MEYDCWLYQDVGRYIFKIHNTAFRSSVYNMVRANPPHLIRFAKGL